MRLPLAPLLLLLTLLALVIGVLVLVPRARAETGIASYYWEGSLTATGARYQPDAVSCAHKTLRFGTVVRVTDQATGRSIECVINDRGPYISGRIIDLSRGAARLLGIIERGVARVSVEVIR